MVASGGPDVGPQRYERIRKWLCVAAKKPAKVPVVAAGAVVLVVGIGLLLWGLAPAKGFGVAMDVFGGSPPPEDLTEQIDAAMAELTARAWASGLGFVGIIGGIITLKAGMPQDKSVEEQVKEEVEKTLGAGATPRAPSGPSDAGENPPPSSQPLPPPTTTPSRGAACPACGSALIAGGRFCPKCGPV